MSANKPLADRFRDEISAFLRLAKDSPRLAVLFALLLIGSAVFWSMSWHDRGERIQILVQENRDLKADLRVFQTENQGLRETVAPLIKQAAEQFPGEEINTSLKKLIEQLELSDPYAKPILTATVTVEVVVESHEEINTHYMDSGGYCAFGKGDAPLLIAVSNDSYARTISTGETTYRSVFEMDASDRSIGKPLRSLLDAEYVQIVFNQIPDTATVVGGSAIVTINSSVRLEFKIPTQVTNEKRIMIRDITQIAGTLGGDGA